MPISEKLSDAFVNPKKWRRYYELFRTLFPESKLSAIHSAKSLSVVIESLMLIQVYGIELSVLYQTLSVKFSTKKFDAEIIDISSEQSFNRSINHARRFRDKGFVESTDAIQNQLEIEF